MADKLEKKRKTLKEWLEIIEHDRRRVICFGTGLMALEAVSYNAIKDAVAFFVDNDTAKQGKDILLNDKYYPVISADELKKRICENDVVMLTSGHFKSMRSQVEKLALEVFGADYEEKIDIVDFPVAKVSYSPDSEEFFEERMLKECLKEYSDVLDQFGICGDEKEGKLSKKKEYVLGASAKERPLVIPRIMIMPTTRCNMRCKGCSSLLPLFEKPCDVNSDQIIKDFEVFFSGIDECIKITIGGEPFLYPDLHQLLLYLLEQKKVLGIMMITNSTIMPKLEVLELLSNRKIFVEISDYGHLDKMSKLIRAFEDADVNFKVLTDQQWTDMGGVECRNRSEEELRFQYLNCDQSRVIKGFHDGWFYTCARSARMTALGAYEPGNDRFKLDENMKKDEIRERLKDMFYRDYAEACNHCDLGVLPTKVIPAGIQPEDSPIKKSRYTIVDREEYEKLKRLVNLRSEN
ncbi:MAG: radical SAM protein [Lachnospiraceae bacterium]|nr:radical SAM protein [Lachnospiraceae bacterium]